MSIHWLPQHSSKSEECFYHKVLIKLDIRNKKFRVTAANFAKAIVSKPKAPPFICTIFKKNGKPYRSNSLHNTMEIFRLFNVKVESSTHWGTLKYVGVCV